MKSHGNALKNKIRTKTCTLKLEHLNTFKTFEL
jgi:hypothetical protein